MILFQLKAKKAEEMFRKKILFELEGKYFLRL
jgi:hypothetical protein